MMVPGKRLLPALGAAVALAVLAAVLITLVRGTT
jgi:hypothetical protein